MFIEKSKCFLIYLNFAEKYVSKLKKKKEQENGKIL